MIEEITPDPQSLPLEEQMNQKLVKANVTEAVIADLRERYLPLKIAGLEDKETYLTVKEGRKNCKAIRVIARKVCADGRESAVAIQKAWVAKEKEVTGRIAEIEDYLEEQEKKYEADLAAEKEARKRKQEEQLIMRQQKLTGMGALYSDGFFVLGEVQFDFSAIKESEDDIWNETILPKYQAEYEKIEAERIEQERIKEEQKAELKRQQEELDRKQKELADKEAALKKEAERQIAEEKARKDARIRSRQSQIQSLGFKYNGSVEYHFHEFTILHDDMDCYSNEEWDGLITRASLYVTEKTKEESEVKRKEQERIELQNKRYAELLPFKGYGKSVAMDSLWSFTEEQYISILSEASHAFNRAEEEKAKKIAEEAAKAERERIEEEQRQAERTRKLELKDSRLAALAKYNTDYSYTMGNLQDLSDDEWFVIIDKARADYEESVRKQEEERKAEELAKSSDREKWEHIIKAIQSLEAAIDAAAMRSGQYRKKAAILREKLEEIKAL